MIFKSLQDQFQFNSFESWAKVDDVFSNRFLPSSSNRQKWTTETACAVLEGRICMPGTRVFVGQCMALRVSLGRSHSRLRDDVGQQQTREALERETLRSRLDAWFISSCLCRRALSPTASTPDYIPRLRLALFRYGRFPSELSFYLKETAPYDFPGDLFKICSQEQEGLFATQNISIMGLAANRNNILTSEAHL